MNEFNTIEFFSKVDFEGLLRDKKKGSRRILQITETSIDLIYRNGLEGFSYEKLSRECGISRSLIYLYFPKLTDLLIFSSSYIRYKYQVFVTEKMSEKTQLLDIFTSYIVSALQWIDVMPTEASVWLIYFHKCSTLTALAKHNSQLVNMGQARIQAMLTSGVEKKIFALSSDQIAPVARTIQILITGALVSRATEYRDESIWQQELQNIANTCLAMAQFVQSKQE